MRAFACISSIDTPMIRGALVRMAVMNAIIVVLSLLDDDVFCACVCAYVDVTYGFTV